MIPMRGARRDMQQRTQSEPQPDLSCAELMLRLSKSGRTAAQIRKALKDEGFSGFDISWSIEYLHSVSGGTKDKESSE